MVSVPWLRTLGNELQGTPWNIWTLAKYTDILPIHNNRVSHCFTHTYWKYWLNFRMLLKIKKTLKRKHLISIVVINHFIIFPSVSTFPMKIANIDNSWFYLPWNTLPRVFVFGSVDSSLHLFASDVNKLEKSLGELDGEENASYR